MDMLLCFLCWDFCFLCFIFPVNVAIKIHMKSLLRDASILYPCFSIPVVLPDLLRLLTFPLDPWQWGPTTWPSSVFPSAVFWSHFMRTVFPTGQYDGHCHRFLNSHFKLSTDCPLSVTYKTFMILPFVNPWNLILFPSHAEPQPS